MLEQLTPVKTEKSGLKVLGSNASLVTLSDTESVDSMEIEESNSELKVKRLTNRVNATSLTKNWYPKTTPLDIQFEERNNLSQFSKTGFTGTLRSWWDKHLSDESRSNIIHAVKRNEEGLPLFDENLGQGIEDGVNTLLYTIVDSFHRNTQSYTSQNPSSA
ncbi:unnamed protein product [Prunus armeniaca]